MSGISRRMSQATGDVADVPRIGHFFVVAGATAAGKSTFLRALASGKLQPEVKSLLPENVDSWISLSKRREEQALQIFDRMFEGRQPNGCPSIGEADDVDAAGGIPAGQQPHSIAGSASRHGLAN